MNEKRIDEFLRQHEPITPDGPTDERVRILSAVQRKSKPTWVRWGVAAMLALTIAGGVAYWLPSDQTSSLLANRQGEETLDEIFDSVFFDGEDFDYDYTLLFQDN